MVTIEIAGIRATIKDLDWTSKDKSVEKVLNSLLSPWGPSGADPYPDLTAAQEAVDKFKGKIIEYDELPDGPVGLVI